MEKRMNKCDGLEIYRRHGFLTPLWVVGSRIPISDLVFLTVLFIFFSNVLKKMTLH
jgi:hypothetical protein